VVSTFIGILLAISMTMISAEVKPEVTSRKSLIILLSIIPPIVLLFFIFKYRIEAPVAMQWEIAPLLEKTYSGRLTFHDLWELHNEHRPIFSRALLISFARFTHWTILYELIANVIFAAITFYSLLYLLKKTEINFGQRLLSAVPVLSLMVFSLNQSENWFGGFNIQILMNVTAVTLGLILLSTSELNWYSSIAAAALGIIGTYTFANGLLFWPIASAIVFLKAKNQHHTMKYVPFWIFISIAAIAFYLYGYKKPPHHPSPWSFLQNPLQAVNYIFAYLGSPLMAFCKKANDVAHSAELKGMSIPSSLIWLFQNAASFVGLAGVILFCFAYKIVRKFKKDPVLISYLALVAYVILSDLLSASGRSAMGIENALSLRYITISSLFWISLFVLLKLAQGIPHTGPHKRTWLRLSSNLIILFVALNSIYGALYAIKLHSYLEPARLELYRMQDEELLKRLLPDTEYIRHCLPTLKKYHLSVFQNHDDK
jgi:hypothetical protein